MELPDPILFEPRVAGALFGAVAAGRVVRRNDRDYLLMPEPAADWGPDLDVTDYMGALAKAGYAVPGPDRWSLTADGEIKASEYAVLAINYPDVLHLRASWAAMSGALIRLSRFEEPTPEQLAQIPAPHATYLLGHNALHQQVRTLWQRHEEAIRLLTALRRRIAGDADSEPEAAAEAYRILAFLRGDNDKARDAALADSSV